VTLLKLPSEYAFNLLSVIGAAVAGFGLGALLHSFVNEAAVMITFGGIVSHVVGMWGRKQISNQLTSIWQSALYWLCWILLTMLAAYLAFSATL